MPHGVFTTNYPEQEERTFTAASYLMYYVLQSIIYPSPKTPNARKEAQKKKIHEKNLGKPTTTPRSSSLRRVWLVCLQNPSLGLPVSNTSFDIPIGCRPKKRCSRSLVCTQLSRHLAPTTNHPVGILWKRLEKASMESTFRRWLNPYHRWKSIFSGKMSSVMGGHKGSEVMPICLGSTGARYIQAERVYSSCSGLCHSAYGK
jgi:hypothetical protein